MALAFNAMLCLSVFRQKLQTSPFPLLPPPTLSLYPFLFITVGSPLPRPLSVFLPHFLMLRSMARWVLFIYGHALSVCVGLSNIHLSCAAIVQSLIPSHMRGMKHEHWSLLRSPSLNTPGSKRRESVCRGEELCRARCALLNTTKRTNRSTPPFFFFFSYLRLSLAIFFNFFFHRLFCLRSCPLLFLFSLVQLLQGRALLPKFGCSDAEALLFYWRKQLFPLNVNGVLHLSQSRF